MLSKATRSGAPEPSPEEHCAIGGETVMHRATLKPAWGWLRWLEVSCRASQGFFVTAAAYSIGGIGQRAEERESYAASVTPTRLVYTQALYECCARQFFWFQTDLDEVEKVELGGTCCGARNVDVHVKGAPEQPDIQLSCCVAGSHGPFRPGQGAVCCPAKHYTLTCLENPESFVEAANRAAQAATRTGMPKGGRSGPTAA